MVVGLCCTLLEADGGCGTVCDLGAVPVLFCDPTCFVVVGIVVGLTGLRSVCTLVAVVPVLRPVLAGGWVLAMTLGDAVGLVFAVLAPPVMLVKLGFIFAVGDNFASFNSLGVSLTADLATDLDSAKLLADIAVTPLFLLA